MRAPSFWAPTVLNRWAITVPGPTTCCPRPKLRGFLRRWGFTTSKNEAASFACRTPAPKPWAPSLRPWPMAKGSLPTPKAPACELPPPLTDTVIFPCVLLKRSEEHTSELQSRGHLVCRLLLEKKNKYKVTNRKHEL